MGDVTGPVSTLPGYIRKIIFDAMCDNHPKTAAIVRVQGETDSFGAEFCDMCPECYESYKKELVTQQVGNCDWCKHQSSDLRHFRDFEEGSAGPVYMVCKKCRVSHQNYIDEQYYR